MRRKRKCVPLRETHSTRFSSGPSRPPRSPLQDRPKLLVAHVAAIVAEAVFVQVALQVLGRDRVIDSANPSLNQHPESLDRIGVRVPANVFTPRMIDGSVSKAHWRAILLQHSAEALIGRELVGVNHALRYDVLANHWQDAASSGIGHGLCDCFPFALDDGDNGSLGFKSHRSPQVTTESTYR